MAPLSELAKTRLYGHPERETPTISIEERSERDRQILAAREAEKQEALERVCKAEEARKAEIRELAYEATASTRAFIAERDRVEAERKAALQRQIEEVARKRAQDEEDSAKRRYLGAGGKVEDFPAWWIQEQQRRVEQKVADQGYAYRAHLNHVF